MVVDLTASNIRTFGPFFYRFTQGDLIHFLFPVGGTGVGRQHVWPNPYLERRALCSPSAHSAMHCLTPKATADRFLKIDAVRYSSSSTSELVFLEGKQYSGYKHRALEFQRFYWPTNPVEVDVVTFALCSCTWVVVLTTKRRCWSLGWAFPYQSPSSWESLTGVSGGWSPRWLNSMSSRPQ